MFLLLLSKIALSLDVYKTSMSRASVTLSPAPTVYDADCLIYVASNRHDQNKNGIWYFVNRRRDSDISVYFYSKYNKDADKQYAYVYSKSRARCSL